MVEGFWGLELRCSGLRAIVGLGFNGGGASGLEV